MKKVIAFAIVLASLTALAGNWTLTSNTVLTENVDSGTAWVLNISVANSTEITVKSVKTVGDSTALDFSGSITGADGYTIVGITGFENKTTLTSVVFPDSLRRLENHAFRGCTGITTVTPLLPASLEYLGWRAFAGCTSLGGDVVFPAHTVSTSYTWANDPDGWFQGSKITSCDMSKATITSWSDKAFQNCTALKWVKLPIGLEAINKMSFYGCTQLTNITPFLPNTIKSIGNQAFYNCTSLALDLKLNTPEEISFLADYQGSKAFVNSAIKSVEITSPITYLGAMYNLTQNGNLFDSMKSCGQIILPKEVATVMNDNWAYCSSLSNLVFLGDFPELNANAFRYLTDKKTRLYFPRFNETWNEIVNVSGYAALDTSLTNQYLAAYPNETVLPIGCLTTSSRKMWVSDILPWQQEKVVHIDAYPCLADSEEGSVYPPYGCFTNFENGVTQVFSAPERATFGGGSYKCIGYALVYEQTPGARDYSSPVTNSSQTCTITQSDNRVWHLTWLWESTSYALKSTINDESVGTISFSPANEGGYEPGTIVTITATANDGGRFVRWDGDVPEGEEHNTTISLTMDSTKSISALFSAPWTYDASANTITDGNWILNVKASTLVENGLTISSVASVVDPTLLDLGQAVSDTAGNSYSLVEIATETFKGKDICFLELGEQMLKIQPRAFYNCQKLEEVRPLLPPTLIKLGQGAFNTCISLTGDVVFPEGEIDVSTTWNSSDSSYGWFYESNITSCDMSKATMSAIVQYSFANCKDLKWVKLPVGITTLGACAFSGAASLASVQPFLPDSVSNIGFSCFYGCSNLESDLIIANTNFVTMRQNGNAAHNGNFAGCKKIKNVKIYSQVDGIKGNGSIGDGIGVVPVYLFNGCTALESIEFWSCITNMANYIFSGNTALKDVYFHGPAPTFNANTFYNVTDKKIRFHVSKTEETWDTFRIENVTSMDATLREEWDSLYPGERRPKGQFTLSSKKMWFFQDIGKKGTRFLIR